MKNKLLRRIEQNNIPRYIVLLIDTYIVCNTFVIAYIISSSFSSLPLQFRATTFFIKLFIILLASLIAFRLIGLYKGIVRYYGAKDVISIFKATALIFVLLYSFSRLMNQFGIVQLEFDMITLIIHLFLNIICLSVARYVFVWLYGKFQNRVGRPTKVMIYGAGNSGLITSATLKKETVLRTKIIGFIDDDKQKKGSKINGSPIYHSSLIDKAFIEENEIDEIIISIQRLTAEQLSDITDRISEFGVKIKIVPPVEHWLNGEFQTKQIKDINIEDLLGREPIAFNNPILKKEFENKTILITGAAGSIGSEISRQLTNFNYKQIVLLDQAESALYDLQQYFVAEQVPNIIAIVADVRNKKRMEILFETYQPDIVFHASAYKHVPFMEENPYESVFVNVHGTKIIADLSVKYRVDKFVMVSTDKAVNPTNVMGTTKRIAEIYVSTLKDNGVTKFITTRFGNVLGSNGSVIPIFKSQIKRGGPLTVTHKDITRFFMTIPESCRLVLEAGAMGNGGEIFVFDMGKSVKIYDLAKKMIKLSGLRYPEDIDIKITGLRPGEKIYEEVLATSENMRTTYNPKIQIANVRAIDKEEMSKKISHLCETIQKTKDDMEIVRVMKEIVPEFVSNNSKFEELDKVKVKIEG